MYQIGWLSPAMTELVLLGQKNIKLGVGKDTMSRIDERPDKSYSTQVFYCATFGATRMEEEKVVSVICDESA